MTTPSAFVYDVDEQSFQADVLERSRTVPVVVDFWAAWCGPCRMLGPILERLADEHQGQFELAKLNTDENPAIAQAFRIEGIPAVKAFKDGKLFAEFTGALPEPQVRSFLTRLLPSEADKLVEQADSLAAAGHMNAAEDTYRSALAQAPAHAGAAVGLARIVAARGESGVQEALQLLSTYPSDPRAAQLKAELEIRRNADGTDVRALKERIAADPKDVEAQYELGMALAAQGDYEQALERLLAVVRLDRTFREDAGRKAMLDVFNLLGNDNPLTLDYRRKLSHVLF